MTFTRISIFVVALVALTSTIVHAQTIPPECETLGFCTHAITTVVDSPNSIFATDLDGDGDIDVLSASFDDNKIAWYENIDGLGTFGPQQTITTFAVSARSVFAADLDGDGDVDVLSASLNDNKIAWYENTDGLGTFGPQKVITTLALAAFSVFAADLDGDGDTDVLSASAGDDKIAWYENIDGLGAFGPQQIITTIADGAQSVFAADLDGDGDIDVLSASRFDDKIAWYENIDGQGNFGPQQVITTFTDNAVHVYSADLDGDGDHDVVSASRFDNKIAWYENTNGLGTFGPQQIITTAAFGASSIFVADLDGDGDADVLSSSRDDWKIAWYENTNGLGDFGPQHIISVSANKTLTVFAADVDGDGDHDVLSPLLNDNKIEWYENGCDCNGNGFHDPCDVARQTSFDCDENDTLDECEIIDGTSMDCNANKIPDHCEIENNSTIDCNNNNRPDDCDITEMTSTDCNENEILDECELIPTFTASVITTQAFFAVDVYATDLDGDGDNDVLSASLFHNKIEWYENIDGLGTFSPMRLITANAFGAISVFAADLDHDGDMDVLSASKGDNKIAWYENVNSRGNFGPQRIITSNALRASSVFAADLDGDGDLDVLSSSNADDKIAWYENTDGLGNFGVQRTITTSANGAVDVYATDLDSDGDNDVLSASLHDNKIAWYENIDGMGTFGPQQIITTLTSAASSVFAIDLDGDGDTDVLSSSLLDNTIAWYENTDGFGNFGPLQIITTEAEFASSVYAVDLDGDGDIDVLSASHIDRKIAWYENIDGLGTFGTQQIITTGADGAQSVFAIDLDGDKDVDVLSASDNNHKIIWYENHVILDCNNNTFPDECDIADGTSLDCNLNSNPDECDIVDGTSLDCNSNSIPDECEECCFRSDCNDDNQCTFDVCDNGVCNNTDNKLCGACCDRFSGFCRDDVLQADCTGTQPNWIARETCQSVICDPATGACCNTRLGTCTNNLIFVECQGQNLSWTKGEDCNALSCPDPFIPAVSQWGLTVMTLLLLIGAKIYYIVKP